MSTASSKTSSSKSRAERKTYADTATERVLEAGERTAEASRKLTSAYLDGVERYFSTVTSFERKLAERSPVEPFAGLLSAHAQLTDELTKAGFSAARELIAA